MRFDIESFPSDVAKMASGNPDRPAAEGTAFKRALDTVFAVRVAEEPFTVPDGHAVAFMTVLLNAHDPKARKGEPQQRKIDSFESLQSRDEAKARAERVTADRLSGIIAEIGSYLPSVLDPSVSKVPPKVGSKMPVALGGHAKSAVSPIHATGATTHARVPLSYAGSAAYIPLAKLLCARITGERGKTAMLIERIANGDVFANALSELGVPADALATAGEMYRRKRDNGLSDVSAIDGDHMKAMFVPDGAGGYVQVTPIPSAAIYTELPQRMRERQQRGSDGSATAFVPRTAVVTSAKPQNVGLHVQYQGGQLTRIRASYYPIEHVGIQRRITNWKNGAPLFYAGLLRGSHAVQRFARLERDPDPSAPGHGYSTHEIRSALDRYAGDMALTLAKYLRDVRDECAADPGSLGDKAEYACSPAVRDLVLFQDRSATEDDRQALIQQALQAVLRALMRVDPALFRTRAHDERVRDRLTRRLKAALEPELP